MHFLITAGGTREHIDAVRFISNASSGRMGYALARAALKAGHQVTLVTTGVNLRSPEGAEIVHVVSAREMFAAVKDRFSRCECLVMAAAVADYAPVRAKGKISKSDRELIIRLRPTVDILKWAGEHKRPNQITIGFALEDKDIRRRAEKKLLDKKLDMIVANTPAAIGCDRACVQIKRPGERWLKLPRLTKAAIAKRIISLGENCGKVVNRR